MTQDTRTRAFRLALAASIVPLFALCLLTALAHDAEDTSSGLAPIAVPAVPAIANHVLSPLGTYAAIAEHPLFSPTRHPAVPPPPPSSPTVLVPPPPPPTPPATTLVAILIGPDHRAAILRLSTGHTSTYVEGDVIEGWTLARVSENQVLLHAASAEVAVGFPRHGTGQPIPSASTPGITAASAPTRRR